MTKRLMWKKSEHADNLLLDIRRLEEKVLDKQYSLEDTYNIQEVCNYQKRSFSNQIGLTPRQYASEFG